MILIAHRALFNGYAEHLENHPNQIIKALQEGFDAEIDVRRIDGEWWLGHDGPTYKVSEDFLLHDGLWLHCKNIEAFVELIHIAPRANYFWHQNDDYTLTSHGFIWTFPRIPLGSQRAILNQPEWDEGWEKTILDTKAAGICSKFVGQIREALK